MMMRKWTAEGLGITVDATSETSARRKLERSARCGVGRVYIDVEAEALDELPDCACGWRGQGSGPAGRFLRGDRCPGCGQYLD